MERKSMGSFIAALRKANGYTQKQLAEKLNVSDKAVSRWERDECAPDLSVIPVLGEIFGVTADELLCGERKQTPEETLSPQRTEKQKKRLLSLAMANFRQKSLISVGISAAAVLIAVIMEITLESKLLTLIMLIVFFTAAVIAEITVLENALRSVGADEYDDESAADFRRKAISFSSFPFAVAFGVLYAYISLLGFLPFCVGFDAPVIIMLKGLKALGFWMLMRSMCPLIALMFIGGGVILFRGIWQVVLLILAKKGVYQIKQGERPLVMFKRIFCLIAALELCTTVAVSMVLSAANEEYGFIYDDRYAFETLDEFKNFAEQREEFVSYRLVGLSLYESDVNYNEEIDDDFPAAALYDNSGREVISYIPRNKNISSVTRDPSGFPIYVRTNFFTNYVKLTIRFSFTAGALYDEVVIFVVYPIVLRKIKKRLPKKGSRSLF